jgi:Nif-specific regulatory protein
MSIAHSIHDDYHSDPDDALDLGRSQAVEPVYQFVTHVAVSDVPVLLCGEPGTGKAAVAEAIHRASPRAQKPFIRVTWECLSERFVERELFGADENYTPGPGRIAEAAGGTVYLEEIDDLAWNTQAKLLRVVLGLDPNTPHQHTRHDVRIVAACSTVLPERVEQRLFRKDLYDEFRAFSLTIPPLRERRPDVAHLAHRYLHRHAEESKRPVQRFSSAALHAMMTYDWPGNLGELDRCVHRAVLLSDGDTIEVAQLPSALHPQETAISEDSNGLQETLQHVERSLIEEALRCARGSQRKAAEQLGITERLMGLRVKRHEIDPRAFQTKS